MTIPFHWLDGATITISATSTSSDNALPATKMPTGRVQLRFYNAGTVPVFIRKGANGVTAVAVVTDMPIAPGEICILTLNNNPAAPLTSIGAITTTTAATLYCTVGSGVH